MGVVTWRVADEGTLDVGDIDMGGLVGGGVGETGGVAGVAGGVGTEGEGLEAWLLQDCSILTTTDAPAGSKGCKHAAQL